MLYTNLTLGDLGLLVVFAIAAIAGVFLIRALLHLGNALRDVRKIIGANVAEIDKVVKDLPVITKNAANLTEIASDIGENLLYEQELLDTALENIGDTIESVTETARSINEDLLGGIKRLAKTLMSAAGFFSKKKTPEAVPAGGAAAAGGTPAPGGAGGSNSSANSSAVSGSDKESPALDDESAAISGKRGRKRDRGVKKAGKKGAAPRRKYADKGRNINIHIR